MGKSLEIKNEKLRKVFQLSSESLKCVFQKIYFVWLRNVGWTVSGSMESKETIEESIILPKKSKGDYQSGGSEGRRERRTQIRENLNVFGFESASGMLFVKLSAWEGNIQRL